MDNAPAWCLAELSSVPLKIHQNPVHARVIASAAERHSGAGNMVDDASRHFISRTAMQSSLSRLRAVFRLQLLLCQEAPLHVTDGPKPHQIVDLREGHREFGPLDNSALL